MSNKGAQDIKKFKDQKMEMKLLKNTWNKRIHRVPSYPRYSGNVGLVKLESEFYIIVP